MSADYIDFDPELQAAGYRAKTWSGRYYTLIAPDGECVNDMLFEDEIKRYAYDHYERMKAAAQLEAQAERLSTARARVIEAEAVYDAHRAKHAYEAADEARIVYLAALDQFWQVYKGVGK